MTQYKSSNTDKIMDFVGDHHLLSTSCAIIFGLMLISFIYYSPQPISTKQEGLITIFAMLAIGIWAMIRMVVEKL